jgi:hypothetical protein
MPATTDINSKYSALIEDDSGGRLPWEDGVNHANGRLFTLLGHRPVGGGGGGSGTGTLPTPTAIAGSLYAGPTFDSVGLKNGSYFIPPDNTSAAGVHGVLAAVNGEVVEWDRAANSNTALTKVMDVSLDSLFSKVSSGGTFDPRILYDPNSDRFIVVAVDQNSTANTSHILVAVSSNGTPHSASDFTTISIDATKASTASAWADFPQVGLDNAGHIYITSNLFTFSGGSYVGSRLWVVNEAAPAAVSATDPSAVAGNSSGELFSLAPTNMADPTHGASGNWLVSYNSATNSLGHNVLNIVHVDASGTPIYTQVDIGHIDQTGQYAGLSAPEPGTSKTIDADDTRAASAVYHDGRLYVAASIVPASGPDAGHVTVHWWALQTDGAGHVTGLLDQGDISGNTFKAGSQLRSYYPSLAVGTDSSGHDELAISFSGSAPASGTGYTGNPSAYEVTINPLAYTDGLHYEHTGGWQLLQAGQDNYYRTFGGGDNRWGDYSSISVDPRTGTEYWAFNQYSMTHGTSFMGENGRWGTELGLFV